MNIFNPKVNEFLNNATKMASRVKKAPKHCVGLFIG